MKLLLPTYAFWSLLSEASGLHYMVTHGEFDVRAYASVNVIHILIDFYILYISRSQFETTKSYLKAMLESFVRAVLVIVTFYTVFAFF